MPTRRLLCWAALFAFAPTCVALPQGGGAAVLGHESSRWRVSLGVGFGPARSEWFDRFYADVNNPELNPDLGGPAVSLRVLRCGGFLPAQTCVGGGIGVTMIAEGKGTGASLCVVGTSDCVGIRNPDDAVIDLELIASLDVVTVSKFTLRIEGGGGIGFFRVDELNGRCDFREDGCHYPDAPGAEPIVIARLVPAITLAGVGDSGVDLNLFISALRTTGETKLTAINFGAEFSVRWAARR